MVCLIGIDIGSTNTKVCAFDEGGSLLASATQPTPWRAVGPRRAHAHASALWATAAECLRTLTAQLNPSDVAGVAVASIGETGVALDARGEPLCKVLAWYDECSLPQAQAVEALLGSRRIYQATGLPPGHTYTALKLLWLQQVHPDVLAHTTHWLPVCDYVAACLGAQPAMGYSQASRSMLMKLETRCWWQEGLQALGLPGSILPQLLPEGSPTGRVTPAAAQQTDLLAGTPIFLGGHDHVCGALAAGVLSPGAVLDSTGTTEAQLTAIAAVQQHLAAANQAFCLGCHVVPDTYYATGAILGAGGLLAWLVDLLGLTNVDELLSLAQTSSPGAEGLYLLPHLAGAGSPDRDSGARGILVGLTLSHRRADLARAAFEGLAYELRVLWQALEAYSGVPIKHVVGVGGGARSAAWSQLKADVTGHALTVPQQSEAVAQGAALLAGLGAGVYADAVSAVDRIRQAESRYQPEPERQARYDQLYEGYIIKLREKAAMLGSLSGHCYLELATKSI